MNIKHILLTAATFLLLNNTAQAEGIGTWRAYMAYHDITDVQQGGQTLYVLASDNLYTYNQNDQSLQTYDKVSGLSDCDIAFIRWNDTAKKLLIVYSNENIDLMDAKGEVTNLSDYYDKSMTDDKTVNHVDVSGQYAYLSTQFGIVKIDMQKEEISETYNLGFAVKYSYIEGNYIYAASQQQGTWRALLTANLLDKTNWTRSGNYVAKTDKIDPDLLAIAETLAPGGPKYNNFGFMSYKNNRLYSAAGGYTTPARPGAIQIWDGNDWTFMEDGTTIQSQTNKRYEDVYSVDVDPLNSNHLFAGARNGLYEFRNGQFVKYYDHSNSLIDYALDSNDKEYLMVTSVRFDSEGNLWLLNSRGKNQSVIEYSKDGEWVSHHKSALMYDGRTFENIVGLTVDSRNLMWFVNDDWRTPSLMCYQSSTDALAQYKSFVNEDGTTVSVTYVRCAAEDKDGNIWIGTNVGPLMLEANNIGQSPSDITFNQVKVPRNDGTNLADYLLTGIDITCMAIDGGGRKWFGTNGNGVYLISEDNYTQIQHFLSTNSPLLSDNIESIAINGETGEVFFGTSKGLCSYKSDATEPVDEMNKDVTYAYPNPVTPDYTGLITVVGLTYDAEVMIATSNGVLVAKGRSNGGTFTWDGCDQQGKRVASGVYMVQTATSDGSKGTVCKIAIIR